MDNPSIADRPYCVEDDEDQSTAESGVFDREVDSGILLPGFIGGESSLSGQSSKVIVQNLAFWKQSVMRISGD